METLEKLIAGHPFFSDLAPQHVQTIVSCASNVRFRPGEFLFREGEKADRFYLLRAGGVNVEIHIPQRGPVIIQTVGAGEVLGWSWLFPPYLRHTDARAVADSRAVAFDGRCLREKCDAQPQLGYQLMKRFARIMNERMQAARLQMIDIYRVEGETQTP